MANSISIMSQAYCQVINGIISPPTYISGTVKRGKSPVQIDLKGRGFYPLEVSEAPEYNPYTQKLVESVRFDADNEKVVKEFSVVALDVQEAAGVLEDVRADALAKIDAKRDRMLTAGFTYDFGGDVGSKTLQTRESDRINWLALHSMAMTLTNGGNPNTPMTLRDAQNALISVPARKVVSCMFDMGVRLSAIYAAAWSHKDFVRLQTTVSGIKSRDIDAGWPA